MISLRCTDGENFTASAAAGISIARRRCLHVLGRKWDRFAARGASVVLGRGEEGTGRDEGGRRTSGEKRGAGEGGPSVGSLPDHPRSRHPSGEARGQALALVARTQTSRHESDATCLSVSPPPDLVPQVPPLRGAGLDQVELPAPPPRLLEVDQHLDAVLAREASDQSVAVLAHPAQQVADDADEWRRRRLPYAMKEAVRGASQSGRIRSGEPLSTLSPVRAPCGRRLGPRDKREDDGSVGGATRLTAPWVGLRSAD